MTELEALRRCAVLEQANSKLSGRVGGLTKALNAAKAQLADVGGAEGANDVWLVEWRTFSLDLTNGTSKVVVYGGSYEEARIDCKAANAGERDHAGKRVRAHIGPVRYIPAGKLEPRADYAVPDMGPKAEQQEDKG